MLNVRYLIEPPAIDIVRWSIYGATRPAGPDRGALPMNDGETLRRQIDVNTNDFYALELVFDVRRTTGAQPGVVVALVRPETGRAVYSRNLSIAELRQPKVYVPIRPFAAQGNSLMLVLQSRGVAANLLRSDAPEGQAPFSYAIVSTPFVLSRELSDGRLFENVDFIERYHAVWRTRKLTVAQFLADRSVDYGTEAVLFEDPSDELRGLTNVPPLQRRAEFTLLQYGGRTDSLRTRSRVPFLLVSSEKHSAELTVEIDGETVRPVLVNGLFAGVPVGPGEHRVRFRRTLGNGFWALSAISLLAFLAIIVADWVIRRRQGRSVFASRHDDDLIGEQRLPQLSDSYQQPL